MNTWRFTFLAIRTRPWTYLLLFGMALALVVIPLVLGLVMRELFTALEAAVPIADSKSSRRKGFDT